MTDEPQNGDPKPQSTVQAKKDVQILTTHQRGVLVSLLGIVWVSPDSLLVRLAEKEQTGSGCVVFYKYFFKFLATSIGLVFFVYGGPRGYLLEMRKGGWHFYAAAILEGITEVMFTLGTTNTSAANNLVLVSANPLWCAILGAVFFKEWPMLHTCAALVLGFGCIVFVFLGLSRETASGRETVQGDLIALGTGIVLALYLTVCRHAGIVRPDATLVPAALLGSTISVLIGFALTNGQVGSACAPKSGIAGWIYSMVNGLVVMPISLACFAIGPKLILSAEVGLIMLLEVLLGPLFVWLALRETPSPWTLIGGGLLVLVLAANESASLWLVRKTTSEANSGGDMQVNDKGSSSPESESNIALSPDIVAGGADSDGLSGSSSMRDKPKIIVQL